MRLYALCAALALTGCASTPPPTAAQFQSALADVSHWMTKCEATHTHADYPYTPACRVAYDKRGALLRSVGIADDREDRAALTTKNPEAVKLHDARIRAQLAEVAATLKP